MGVYVPKLQLPHDCEDCYFLLDNKCLHGSHSLCIIEHRETHSWDMRPTWCPLVEVKPHGRLIDADALKVDDGWLVMSREQFSHIQFVYANDIINSPAIIEAETCNNSENTCNKTGDDAVNASFPCDTCRFNPPSSCDGKPCTMCDTSNPLTNCYQKAEGEDD